MGTNNLIILFELLFYEYYTFCFLEIRISFKDYKKAIKKSIFKTFWECSSSKSNIMRTFQQCFLSMLYEYRYQILITFNEH